MAADQTTDITEAPLASNLPPLEDLWTKARFHPNEQQEKAIRHPRGPLYLPSGPGSGKTRVLLWRAINLIVYHGVRPEEIFLATFTEKAALQLKEGLRSLLSIVTQNTHRPYDVSKMYVGTVHSLCRQLLADRRFYEGWQKPRPPVLLDELGQYMLIRRRRNWELLLAAASIGSYANRTINEWFGKKSMSRHVAITNCIAFFNRLSEECIDPNKAVSKVKGGLRPLLKMYKAYREILESDTATAWTDFPLIQQEAMNLLANCPASKKGIFQHVIIDEYQDTNTIQEQLFFKLASMSDDKNICVVGDDDQALYRFRGATVENFVEFSSRCQEKLGVTPDKIAKIALGRNYRSRKCIVDFFKSFITHDACDWDKKGGGSYRVTDKDIHAKVPCQICPKDTPCCNRADDGPVVVATDPGKSEAMALPICHPFRVPAVAATDPGTSEDVAEEIAKLVRKIIDEKKVKNPNQIAFLFPSFQSKQPERMRDALKAQGLDVYAPRAVRFLEVEEATAMLGLCFQVFGWPERSNYTSSDYQAYYNWLDAARSAAKKLMADDSLLARYVHERKAETVRTGKDYLTLLAVAERHGWDLETPYDPDLMCPSLATAAKLSDKAIRALNSRYFKHHVRRKLQEGRPILLRYVISRASSLDWTVLDLFYQLCGFRHFREMFDLAERGEDEGPVCNLSLVSQYLSRYLEEYPPVITGEWLHNGSFLQVFNNYLYVLFRRGESGYEDAEDPFPKGRIPFITIHQAKGLEFPVVILANPCKKLRGPQQVETMVRKLLGRDDLKIEWECNSESKTDSVVRPPLRRDKREPLERMDQFDAMRMFYVALSRAKNLLVIAHFKGPGLYMDKRLPFRTMLEDEIPRIRDLDVAGLPDPKPETDYLPRPYSYTGDFLAYKRCPRQYMVFRRYNFAVSRSQTMFFGSLVHQTIEDLHQYLIDRRKKQ